MTKHYLKPQTQVFDFLPEATLCTTSGLQGSTSDYDEDGGDIFDD